MVLGKLPMLILIIVGQGPSALVVGAGRVVWTFFLSSITSLFSPSLWETARYREILSQRAVKPKTTNQLTLHNLGRRSIRKSIFSTAQFH